MPEGFRPSKSERIGKAISGAAQNFTGAVLDTERLRQSAQQMQEQSRQFNEQLQLQRQKFDVEREETLKARNIITLNKADQFIERGLKIEDARARKVYFERNADFISNAYKAMDPGLEPAIDQLIAGGDAIRAAHKNVMKINFKPFQKALKLSNKDLDNFIDAFGILGADPVAAQKSAYSVTEEDRQVEEAQQYDEAADTGKVGGRVLQKSGPAGLELEAQPAPDGGFQLQPRPVKGEKARPLSGEILKGTTAALKSLRSTENIEAKFKVLEKEKDKFGTGTGPIAGRVNAILADALGISTPSFVAFRQAANAGQLEKIKELSGVSYSDKQLEFMKKLFATEVRTPAQIRTLINGMRSSSISAFIDTLRGGALADEHADAGQLKNIIRQNAKYLELGGDSPLTFEDLDFLMTEAGLSRDEVLEFTSLLPPSSKKYIVQLRNNNSSAQPSAPNRPQPINQIERR